MKLPAAIALTVLGFAALLVTSVIFAQVRVKIVPQGNSAESDENEDAPEKPEVEGIDPTPEEFERIAELIRQLGAPSLARRDRAMSELASFEKRALGQVRDGKGHDNDEIAHRCTVLEEVIESGQGELFLAARRLNLSINELQEHLGGDDVTSLLRILETRAQPGMVPLWSMILSRLSGRSQLYKAAEVCRQVEGTRGYGEALTRASRAEESQGNSPGLRRLMVLLPPGDPRDVVESLTQLRFAESGGIEGSLSSAADFRGLYEAEIALAALSGRPDAQGEDPEGAPDVRIAMALAITDTCTPEELDGAGLPGLTDMSPLILSQWLGLVRRSGLNELVAGALPKLREAGADTRRISIAAAAWADVTPIREVIDAFDGLPFAVQLSVLDALWRNPREPRLLHPWLIELLGHEHAGMRQAAARHLGQYRSAGSVRALLRCVREDAVTAPVALESLRPMADLLRGNDLEVLAGLLPEAGLSTRTRLAGLLVAAGHDSGLQPLIEQWKTLLPRNELALALRVLARDSTTPAGSYASATTVQALGRDEPLDDFLLRAAGNDDLEMLRALLALDDDAGFALLEEIAGDLESAGRVHAMTALALAGRDAELIDEWIKRLVGEIQDPQQNRIGQAIAMSATARAESFRRESVQQGSHSNHLRWVVLSYLAGRTQDITREQLLDVLFDTPNNAAQWARLQPLVSGPLTPKAVKNIAGALVLDGGSILLGRPSIALMLRAHDVDFLDVMFGSAEAPVPSNPGEILLTAIMIEPEKAARILERVSPSENGLNYVELQIAKAWLRRDGEGRRIALAASGDPSSTIGALWRLERALAGDVRQLRGLLDAYGPDAARFETGATASVELIDRRYGSAEIELQGVAAAGVKAGSDPPALDGAQLAPLFRDSPPQSWRDWWSCRRALVQFDESAGRYVFVELP